MVNHKLVAQVVAELGLEGLPKRKSRKRNLVSVRTTSDLAKRNFSVTGPNQLWVTDIREHPTREGLVSACAVLDAFSRKAVGRAIDRKAKTALVNQALHMAWSTRETTRDSIIHADHGTQGGSAWFFPRTPVKRWGRFALVQSMGRVASAADNAAIESFFALLQKNVLNQRTWTTREQLRIAMVTRIEATYHRRRRQDALGGLTPVEYGAIMSNKQGLAASTKTVTKTCTSPEVLASRALILGDTGGTATAKHGNPPLVRK